MERPILALHGWLDNCGTFAKLAPLIAPYRSVLCIDLPGHGRSSHLPVGILYHNTEFVRVILRIMKSYKWKTVSLMGHSMGGSVCFHFTAIYPDRVDMVISLDIIKTHYWEPQIFPKVIRHVMEKALIENERLQNINTNNPPIYTFEECENILHQGSMESIALNNCKYILQRNIKKSELFPQKYYFSRDGRMKYINDMNPDWGLTMEMSRRICNEMIPYLVIKGGQSKNISAQATKLDEFMVQNNKNFQCHIYATGTHHLHLNNSKPVAKLIINFLHNFKEKNLKMATAKL